MLLEAKHLEVISNIRQIDGVMVRGCWYARADLDLILEAVAKDHKAAETTRIIIRIAFPVAVVLLLAALVWFVVRRRKTNQVSS